LAALGKYVVAVLLGLGIHGGLVLPGLYTLATAWCGDKRGGGGGGAGRRRRRWWLSRGSAGGSVGSGVGGGLSDGGGGDGGDGGSSGGGGGLSAAGVFYAGAPAMITAFATDSSSAALPVTRRCARAMGIPDALADFALPLGRRFVSPTQDTPTPLRTESKILSAFHTTHLELLERPPLFVGATVNMNGTALYEALTVLFIAQLHNVNLGPGATVVGLYKLNAAEP
jgi:hypothetical protein